MSRVVNLDLEVRPYATPAPVRINTSGNPCRVPHCDMLAGDGYICPSCVESWEVNLGNITALVEDLEIAERKAVRFAPSGGSSSGEPEIANLAAGYWLGRLRNELVGQIRLICETGHIKVPELRDNTVAMSRWLLRQSARLPKMGEDEGWGLVHDLDQMVRDCLTVIDAPARRKYVLECETCSLAVWARGDAETARCACGAEYDVAAEHEARMMVARDYLVTIDEAAAMAKVRAGTIRQWIARGRVQQHGTKEVDILRDNQFVVRREVALVKYGDVVKMAERETA